MFNDVQRFMPYLLVAENPNKFLKLALETRKACLKGKRLSMFKPSGLGKVISIKNKDDSDSDVTNPLDRFYIGLEQVAQFLNFCVMLRQIPTKEGQEIKNIDKIEKLSFDKSVLKEFTDQYKQEKTSVENTIGKENIETYKTQLKDLRAKYNNYCRAMINGKNNDGSYDKCISFTKWISQSGDFVEGVIHEHDGGPLIGVYKNDENKIIDREDVAEKEVKHGYHEGGGITDENELTKLLKLDAVLQAEKAIDKFIDTKALEPSVLESFIQWWNNCALVKVFKFLTCDKKFDYDVKLKSHLIIPKLSEINDNKNKD